ncbi:recombinase family protein [Microbacterium sp. C7(2022)]|uniref:recombinase family protein n=1 Tax=Microbacterium sp. C7(2022) TaxID=2992759 RepID=UPI00237C486B|nr:recombinase family protein [Microbacterium sp. C7(2022)]MDE0545152.1 dehydrogenase [Microbacterium sp. C7(2022)]
MSEAMSETLRPAEGIAATTGDAADSGLSGVASDTAPLHLPHAAAECPRCFSELQADRHFWQARPAGSRLVGLVISRDDMPSVVEQRNELTRFGVPIEGFRHPAPETLESWEERLVRLFGTLRTGDVLVVANIHALGRNTEEESRTIAALRGRGVIVKVLSHTGRHLADPVR